jgi:hypothetical protein
MTQGLLRSLVKGEQAEIKSLLFVTHFGMFFTQQWGG